MGNVVAGDVSTDIDKKQLYGRYQDDEDWRVKLNKKLRHKALDIPMDDDVNVKTTNNTRIGFGWKELAVLGGLGLGGAGLYTFAPRAAKPDTPPAVKSLPDAEQKFDVYHYQRNPDGTITQIRMDPLPPGWQDKIKPAK